MIPDEEYLEAVRGKTPEMAFVYLESRYRAQLHQNLQENDNSGSFDASVLEYMNHALAAAKALDLVFLDEWSVPSHKRSALYDEYRDFHTGLRDKGLGIRCGYSAGFGVI